MKIKPRTQKDFEWVNWTPKKIEEYSNQSIEQLKKDIADIIAIPKENRTFENTVYAFSCAGHLTHDDNPVFFLEYVSTKESVRDTARTARQKVEKESIEIMHNKKIYDAFMEYDPKSEDLNTEESRLYKHMRLELERAGFNLPEKTRNILKKLEQNVNKWGSDFGSNISNHHDYILCTKEELEGLSDGYIANLEKDKKTGKYMVTLAYPEFIPFMDFAVNRAKRKELADKASQKGGKKNIALLKKILPARHEIAKILGYKNYAEYTQELMMAKNPTNVKNFLTKTIKDLKPTVTKEFKEIKTFAEKDLNLKDFSYYDGSFVYTKLQEKIFGFDENEVKEYFEINTVLEGMLVHFGGMFGVSFKRNTTIKTWNKDVLFFDVVEKGKVISHVGFDLYPRKGKYSHMACWFAMGGQSTDFRSKEHEAPVAFIVGNFPKGTKKNPSLLSVDEMQTLFHEFGHAMHGCLSHTQFYDQCGMNVVWDFVEVPSQLFENWARDEKFLKKVSKHYKTGEKIDTKLLKSVVDSFSFRKASSHYGTFTVSLMDLEMHTTKFAVDPLVLAKEHNKKYGFLAPSSKSLFPAGWGHLKDYAAKYYSYMWSIVYSHDIFSRFEQEGVYSKKLGKELRAKILAPGDTKDAEDLLKDFLGRESNNKAFLENLGIK